MKSLIVYFTMGGRTKRMAKALADALTKYETTFFPIELTGRLIEKIKQLDKYEKNDFSAIENELNSLDAAEFDLIIIGMPTYGDKTPNAFIEILARMKNLKGKKAIVFSTARFSGGKARDYMKAKAEEAGAQVIDQTKFRRMFYLGTRMATKFGIKINEQY